MRTSRTSLALAGTGAEAVRPRQNVSPADSWSRRAVAGLLFSAMPWLMRLASAVSFRSIQVRGAERFPKRGPVLLVANHPATWTDVLVLHVALGRKLHFLAQEPLFRPTVRAWLLRLYGALPVSSSGNAAERGVRNERTLKRCRRLLERGEVIAIFPEGVSEVDRSILAFKPGAARIALDSCGSVRPLPVVPTGIHYLDRTAFRTHVVVSIGHPVRLPIAPESERDIEGWIAATTARLEEAVTRLILDLPDPRIRAAVEELAPLIPCTPSSDPAGFRRSRCVARWLLMLRGARPADFASTLRHARRHRKLREALALEPLDVSDRSWVHQAGAVLSLLAGAPLALIGLILNGPPALLAAHVARRFDPTRVALARIAAGAALFGLWYAVIVAGAAVVGRSLWVVLATLFATLALAGCAVVWSDAWHDARARFRWVQSWRSPRLMAQLRAERAALLSLLEQTPAGRARSKAGETAG